MKLFLIKMIDGSEFEIEPEELPRVVEAIKGGGFIRLKRGIVKSSVISSISPINRLYGGKGLGDMLEILGNDKKLIK